MGAIQTDDFYKDFKLEIDHLGNSNFLNFSMINLNLKYNNDDLKNGKNKLEINRIGNKNCWIKN